MIHLWSDKHTELLDICRQLISKMCKEFLALLLCKNGKLTTFLSPVSLQILMM